MKNRPEPQAKTCAPDAATIARFAGIVGPAHALTDPDLQMPYLTEWRDRFTGAAALVLRPGSTAQVAAIMALAHETGTAIVPQTGNTGLVGGQIPNETGAEVLLSLKRLNRVRSIDKAGTSMICEAGVTLEEAHGAASSLDRLFALSLPSKGTCCIGGNLATNAGGVDVLSYGNARAQVLGLEVVLADGRIWDGLRALKKDNTGYDLRDLFIGSEGTLGIITAAVLKLAPRPAERATAMVVFSDIDRALPLFMLASGHAGAALTGFEVMARRCIEFVLRHIEGTRDPLKQAYPWYGLLEVSGLRPDGSAQATLEKLLGQALGEGLIEDAALATSESQTLDLWHLRESISEAQKPEGGSIKHDISVPVPKIPEFIRRADGLVEGLCPGARPVPFGHFGDGNIHYNVSQPKGMASSAFLAKWDEITAAIHELVTRLDGSISAEHGIGRLKKDQLTAFKSDVEMALMRAIKTALDPKGILNPGKLL